MKLHKILQRTIFRPFRGKKAHATAIRKIRLIRGGKTFFANALNKFPKDFVKMAEHNNSHYENEIPHRSTRR